MYCRTHLTSLVPKRFHGTEMAGMCGDGTSITDAQFYSVNWLCSFHLDILTVDCTWRQSFYPTDLVFQQRQRRVICESESQCLKWNIDSVNQQLDPTVAIVMSHQKLYHNGSVLIYVLSLVLTATPCAECGKAQTRKYSLDFVLQMGNAFCSCSGMFTLARWMLSLQMG